MKRSWIPLVVAGLVAGLAGTSAAQSDDEARARELIAKIKKEMRRIDELLLQMDRAKAAEAGASLEEVKKSIDELLDARELLENVTRSQGEVIDGIDELVKMTKYQKSNQRDPNADDSDQQQKEQQKNQERERDQDPQDLRYQGDPKEQRPQGEKPQGEKDEPKDGREDQSRPEQREGQKPPPSETGNFENEDVSGRWGNLPPKVAEMFQQLGPEAFPVKYRKLLDQYYRKSNRRQE